MGLELMRSEERRVGKECEQGRGRDRGRERLLSRLHTVSAEPNEGLELRNREIMT